jgi:hypothetical protein
MLPPQPDSPREDEDPVPVFGSWRAIYAAVIVSNLVVMALVTLFSHWSF